MVDGMRAFKRVIVTVSPGETQICRTTVTVFVLLIYMTKPQVIYIYIHVIYIQRHRDTYFLDQTPSLIGAEKYDNFVL